MSETIDYYSENNRTHFNNTAHTYDDIPMALEVTRKIGAAILKLYDFDENSTTVMEYACGTGLVSRELSAHVKSIIGVDISQGMVDQYNLRVFNQGIPPEEMRAVCAELKGDEGELDGQKFDVVVCAQAYHHFTSIEDVTRILASFLKPGGTLFVVDIIKSAKEGDSDNTHWDHVRHVVAHAGGFEEWQIQNAFDGAQLEQYEFIPAVTMPMPGREKTGTLFVAKALRPNNLAN